MSILINKNTKVICQGFTGREGTYRFLTTGDPLGFKEMGSRFLQLPIADVERVTVAELERVAA